MKTILARLQEPSTYAGLSGLLALGGLNLPESKFQVVAHAVAALAAAIAMFMGEGNGPTPSNP